MSARKPSQSDQMMMFRGDIKPGNGASFMSYQNHMSLKKNIKESVHLVDDRASQFYIDHHQK